MKPNFLVVPEDLWNSLETHLARRDVESMAFGFLGQNRCSERTEFLLHDTYLPSDGEFSERRAYGISLRVSSACTILEKLKFGAGLVDIHTHPDGLTQFSSIDDCGHRIQMQNVLDFSPNAALIRIVKESDNYRAEVTYKSIQPQFEPIDVIKIIGNKGLEFIYPRNSRIRPPSIGRDLRLLHQRTLDFYDPEALNIIQQSEIGIIGLGGTGAGVLNLLKFFPFKSWILVDADTLESHNANRFFGFNRGDEGKYKVDVLARELHRFDPTITVVTVKSKFPTDEANDALKASDILVVAPDNNTVRYAAAKFAMRYLKPLIELGSGITMKEGRVTAVGSQVRFQLPTLDSQCIVCSGLDVSKLESDEILRYKKDIGYIIGTDDTPASVVTINTMAAAVATHLLINYLGNYVSRELPPSYIEYNERELQLKDHSHLHKRNPECTICGRHGDSIFGKGDLLPKNLKVLSPLEVETGLESQPNGEET